MTKREIEENAALEKMGKVISHWRGEMEFCLELYDKLDKERKQILKQLDRLERKYSPKEKEEDGQRTDSV